MIEVEGKIDNHPITILIDSGASHSYINSNIVEIFHLQRSKHKKSWLVQLATGAKRNINELVKYCPIDMNGLNTKVDVNIIPLGSYECSNWHGLVGKTPCYPRLLQQDHKLS
jgi:predicted aspartyl protease